MAVRICHDRPADLALADAYASRPEGDEPVDLRLLIAVDGWSEVRVAGQLVPTQDAGPEAPKMSRVVRIEAESEE